MKWDRLAEADQREAIRLAALGRVHPRAEVACAAWELASETASPRAKLADATALVVTAIDLMFGGAVAGPADNRTMRQRRHDRRVIRSIYRVYRKSEIPAQCAATRGRRTVNSLVR